MDLKRTLIIIAIGAGCTFFERALPFLVFGKRPVPRVVQYLGKLLPMAVMATLVVYCLRGTTFTSLAGFAPQAIACAVVIALHLWRKNSFLSILGGTAAYMVLVQTVFV